MVHILAKPVENSLPEGPQRRVLRQTVEHQGEMQYDQIEPAANRVGDGIVAVKT